MLFLDAEILLLLWIHDNERKKINAMLNTVLHCTVYVFYL